MGVLRSSLSLCPSCLPSVLVMRLALALSLMQLFYSCLAQVPYVKTQGPCQGPPVTINVRSEADFALRRLHKPNQMVFLRLLAHIQLKKPLVFDGNFSCTQLYSNPVRQWNISYSSGDEHVFRINMTSNVLIYGVNFHSPITDNYHPQCNWGPDPYKAFISYTLPCAAVQIYGCKYVQLTQGIVVGRIDLWASNWSRVDSMQVIIGANYTPAAIWVQASGYGPTLTKSNTIISNNVLYAGGPTGKGAKTGLLLSYGAVGTTVYRNQFHDFTFAGMILGQNTNNVGDSMLHTVEYNKFDHNFGQLGDSAAIYLDTHWVNPGNIFKCNYVNRGGHCLYIDFFSSGLKVEGLICNNVADGVKQNGGKNNVINGMLVVNSTNNVQAGISCGNYDIANCGDHYPANVWAQGLYSKFQTPQMKKYFPWMTTICNVTKINGVDCLLGSKISSKVTVGCSGLPTGNDFRVITVANRAKETCFCSCQDFPNIDLINHMQLNYTNFTTGGFIDWRKGDYGLRSDSPLRKLYPGIPSCPLSLVGPKPVVPTYYLILFNRRMPPTNMLNVLHFVARK
jgi:hypothetical protein